MTLGNKIAELRKEKGITQEVLANALGVSNQAVSKWEANQSCPDIQLLPQIADLFGITLDDLFGRKVIQEETVVTYENHMTGKNIQVEGKEKADLPWEDDGKLRAVIYIGHKLVMEQECTRANEITFMYNGAAVDIISSFSVTCDDVGGNITANGSVTCDVVGGNVKAYGSVTCDEINGCVDAGGNVTSDEINGDVHAGGNVTCDEINGDLSAGGTVTCDGFCGSLSIEGKNLSFDELRIKNK